MGHVSIVYGNIIGATWKTDDYHKLQRMNRKVIENLPDKDGSFPWITRNMFLAPDPENTEGTYREQVIVFGASYKSVEREWPEWLEKFEAILKRLFWYSSTIHLDIEGGGRYTYEWVYDFNQFDYWMSDDPRPVTSWEFTGGPREFY